MTEILSILFIFLGLGGLYAQETVPATGGDASGSGGSSSYTVGQVIYTTNTGTNGSVAQGVQQPYEISTTVGINETSISLELSVYPNPTSNYLTLKIEETDGLIYQLLDMQGKLLDSKQVSSNTTQVEMERLPTSTYILKITKNSNPIKTFKIIKN